MRGSSARSAVGLSFTSTFSPRTRMSTSRPFGMSQWMSCQTARAMASRVASSAEATLLQRHVHRLTVEPVALGVVAVRVDVPCTG